MAATQSNWRASTQYSVAGSASIRDRAPPSSLRRLISSNGVYQPVAKTGEKRLQHEAPASVASKYSRFSYSSRPTIKTPGWLPQTTTTSNVASISRGDYFKPGTVVLADHFEEAYNDGSVYTNNKSIIRVAGQKDICKKGRFFIIVAAHALSYISLPVYSHNGNGTKNKPNPEEYISIRDHRATVEAPPQSSHDPLVTQDMSGPEMMTVSVVHLAYPVARRYITPITVIGRLNAQSTRRLIQLFSGYIPVNDIDISDTVLTSSTDVLISASMNIPDALQSVRLRKYSLLFAGLSWIKAASLSDSGLIELGVIGPDERKKLSLFFKKVMYAKRAGHDWKLTIDPDSLVAT